MGNPAVHWSGGLSDEWPLDPRLFTPRFRQHVGPLVIHGKAGVCARFSITEPTADLPTTSDDVSGGDPLERLAVALTALLSVAGRPSLSRAGSTERDVETRDEFVAGRPNPRRPSRHLATL